MRGSRFFLPEILPGSEEPHLIRLEREKLLSLLCNFTAPVMEVALFRSFDELQSDGDLFTRHFSLYHALYSLKKDPALRHAYLHCDPMRIRLVDLPDSGYCREYMPATGEFCREPSKGDYCDIHGRRYASGTLLHDPLTQFYLDPGNIAFGSDPRLAELAWRVTAWGLNFSEIEKARRFMGLEKLAPGMLRDRYYLLARQWHPGREGGSEELMQELNRSYDLLGELLGR